MTQRRAVYSRFPFIYAPEEAFREIYRQARRIFAKLAGQVIKIEEKEPSRITFDRFLAPF